MDSTPEDEQLRAARADQAWQHRDLETLCRLYAKQIETNARNVAVEFQLPWGLSELRQCGWRSIYELARDPRLQQFGWPFSNAAPTYIPNKIRQCGESMHNREEGLRSPPDEHIREALQTFSEQEWRDLITRFEERDLKALRAYLEANKEELEHSLGRRKYEIIFANVAKRGWILFLKQKLRYIPTSDPMWVLLSRRWAREHNMKLGPRPSEKRSVAEMGSMRALAESLSQQGRKVTDKKIATYLERMEQVPFDQFDGNRHDYFTMIADTRAYNRYLRSQQVD